MAFPLEGEARQSRDAAPAPASLNVANGGRQGIDRENQLLLHVPGLVGARKAPMIWLALYNVADLGSHE